MRRPKKLSPEEKEKEDKIIVKMFKQHHTITEIMAAVNRGYDHVVNVTKKYGVYNLKRGRRKNECEG